MLLSRSFCLLSSSWPLHLAAAQSSPDTQQPLHPPDALHQSSPLLTLHKSLVNIPSISNHEHAIGLYLQSYLQSLNYTVELQPMDPIPFFSTTTTTTTTTTPPPPPQRYNLLAYPGRQRQTPVLLTSHMDTVPPFYPYATHADGSRWGRGSVDAKACVATQIAAVEALLARAAIARDDVALLFVVGEEAGGDGMRRANALGLAPWRAVIFGEPTELKLAAGHKGHLALRVAARGRAAHSGYPWLGESAVSMLLPALLALERTELLPSSAKYGDTTLNIGRVEGGVAPNVVAEEASALIAIRLAAGTPELGKGIVEGVVRAVDERLEVAWLNAGYGPVEIDADVEGFETMTVNYGTDIPNLEGDHKRYLYGPGSILLAHSDHEHLGVEDLEAAVEGYQRLIMAALKS